MGLKNNGEKAGTSARKKVRVVKQATDGQNPDIVADKLAALKQLVPEVFVEGKLDAGLLQKMFKKDSVAGVGKEALAGTAEGERYGLSWAGKKYVYEEIAKQSVCTLTKDEKRSLPKKSLGKSGESSNSDNLFIEGENLEVLRTLQKAYFNRVKMIYIDPPYNTGKDFVYHDNFRQTEEDYCDECNVTENEHLTKALKLNSRDGGRFHSNWLNMMYPRLFLARNLLSDDGVIFVSIDDNEVHNLRMVMNEIFGEENFVGDLIWKNKHGGGGDSPYLVQEHENVFIFAKDITKLSNLFVSPHADYEKMFRYEDDKGKYYLERLDKKGIDSNRPNLIYPISCPDGTVKDITPAIWRLSESELENRKKEGLTEFKKDKNNEWQVYTKTYLYNSEGERRRVKARSILKQEIVGFTQNGNKEMVQIFDKKFFDNPKPVALIQFFLDLTTKEDDIILDFFAGSGTTAHAVMAQNIADGGNRSYICVQMPEETPAGSEARKAGYERISDIAIERVGRASAKLQAEHPDYAGDLGVQVYRATDSHFAQWRAKAYDDNETLRQDIIDYVNAVPQGTPRERADEVLLKLGYPLTTPLQDMGNWYLAGGALALLLDEKFKAKDLMSVFEAKPTTVIVLEQIFKKDEEKINFDLRCTERKVIFQTI